VLCRAGTSKLCCMPHSIQHVVHGLLLLMNRPPPPRLPPLPTPLFLPPGLYSPSFAASLQHLGDVVVSLETLGDDSDVYQLLPDPAR
jgi:hypothetical protein